MENNNDKEVVEKEVEEVAKTEVKKKVSLNEVPFNPIQDGGTKLLPISFSPVTSTPKTF